MSTLPTLAIVIGVSSYLQDQTERLPAAQVDAVHFARAIKNWGVPESQITLFLNERATLGAIETLFDQLEEIKESYQLVFYFSGHGYRQAGFPPKSFLLFHDSLIESETCSRSLSLDVLIEKIGKLHAQESYIFIDACYLRINALINPKLEEEIEGQKISKKSLLCLLSSGIEESFESETEQYGYFTEALLHSLSQIRKENASLTDLFNLICQKLEGQGLALPEMYNIGSQKIEFLSSSSPLERGALLANMQDQLVRERGKIVCFTGESGSGKSYLAKSLVSDKLKTLYFSFHQRSIDPVDYLAIAIKGRFSNLLDEGMSSEELLVQFGKKYPFYLLILDQLEKLDEHELTRLLHITERVCGQFLFVSSKPIYERVEERFRKKLIHFDAAPFTLEESRLLIDTLMPECGAIESEWIHLISQGNPLKMQKASLSHFLSSVDEIEKESLTKTVAALSAVGFYINERLFVATFHISEENLHFLKSIGLLMHQEKGWVPHEFLNEMVHVEDLKIDGATALLYWQQQIDELSNNIFAVKSLILLVNCLGYEENDEPYLKIAFYALYPQRKEQQAILKDGAEIFLSRSILTEASLLLAEILMEIGVYELCYKLLACRPVSEELASRVKLCQVQGYWRMGYLDESIALATECMLSCKNDHDLTPFIFNRGVAHFWKGYSNEAYGDFKLAFEQAEDPSLRVRAQSMLGTLVGLLGIDLPYAIKFLEEGGRELLKLKDMSGAWMSWNNLGEIFWKCGEYTSASFYLEKALDLAITMKNEGATLETLRNLLHLYLRTFNPFSNQVSELLHEIESMPWKESEFFTRMQIQNALVTAHIFRKEAEQARDLLTLVLQDTSKNGEYHIYTLSNLALFYKLIHNERRSSLYIEKATQLAKRGENHLAIELLKQDLAILNQHI